MNPSDQPTEDNSQKPLPAGAPDAEAAADLIRGKLTQIYSDEPNASQEMAEAGAVQHRSPHQQFMYDLSTSGKDLATIQTEWHNYYQNLPDHEKHQVWQEFYESQTLMTGQPAAEPEPQKLSEHKHEAAKSSRQKPQSKTEQPKLRDVRSTDEVKEVIRDKVSAGGKLQAKHHVQSLLFGLGMGVIVLIIFLFGFFNEVIIAPFIQPSRAHADTPLIIDSNSVAPTSTPEVIIPKINVEIPVNNSETSTDENAIESDLLDGVVHYPTTSFPGQTGNAAFFGHSSNNIFNKGKYKFAFVLLHTLEPGDTFYLTYNSKVYVYKVITKTIVNPDDVGVLNPVPGQTATATLITCDPPGTSIHRLVVVGQQVSPDPSGNSASTAATASTGGNTNLPSDGPSAWSAFIKKPLGKLITIAAIVVLIFVAWRKVWQPFWRPKPKPAS